MIRRGISPGVVSATRPIMVLGVDTGLANTGWCFARMDRDSLIPEKMNVISSESNAKKRGIKSGDDDWARSTAIARVLHKEILTFRPSIITCEGISHVRNSAAMAKIGRVFGVLATLALVHDLPVLHASPQEIKIAVCGGKAASKDEIMLALDEQYEGIPRGLLDISGIRLGEAGSVGRREHAYDALGSMVACWDNEPMRMLRTMAR